jgi:restriction endonuclease Mrr
MLISEFIDRTGFRPTEDYYHTVIEPEYNASDLEKDAWCKQWKKNGGIQKAYDALKEQAANEYANVLSLESKNKELSKMIASMDEDLTKYKELSETAMSDLNAAQEREQSMMYELLEISEKYSSAELKEIIINAIGFKEYISYKFEHDVAIWQLDRDKIIENLK